ncbi:MAG: right-handed parallel beta-helix repeat-containing protein [Leptospiraceae bacterium]|nr:right-handed parallel beta-helix repeat-containing protein [Leptospiraceae bacterium]
MGLFITSASNSQITLSGKINGWVEGQMTIVLNSSAESVLSTPTNSFQFKTNKGKYELTIKSNPSSHICTLKNNTGDSAVDVNNIEINCETILTKVVYANNSNWNDYVKNNGSSRFTASNTPCTGSETGGYNACIHAGEIRKVELSSESSCTNLTATDALGAFHWLCRVENGKVVFYSSGLATGKYLSDLIDFDTVAWKKNSVSIQKSNVNLISTTNEAWWTNPIVLNNTSFSTSGTIYIFTTNPGNIFITEKPKIGIVFHKNLISDLGSSVVTFYLEQSDFSWVEGKINPRNGSRGFNLNNSKFSVVKNFAVTNTNQVTPASGGSGIYLTSVQNSFFQDIRIVNGYSIIGGNSNIGLHLFSSNNNLFQNLTISNMSLNGILFTSSTNNSFFDVVIQNTAGSGIATNSNSNSNSLFNLTITNSNSGGLQLLSGNNILVSNFASFSIGSLTSHFPLEINTISNSTFQNIATGNSSGNNISLTSSSNNYFTGNLRAGVCTVVTAGVNPGIINTPTLCSRDSVSDFNQFNGYTNSITISGGTNFIDKVSSDDTINSSDSSGGRPFASITDWINFENRFRSWGVDGGSSFPAAVNRGFSDSGNFRIYDWSLRATDTQLRNVNPCPNEVERFNSADTNVLSHTFTSGSVTFLRDAVEILGDGVGDEDGFCESNEHCIFTPNIGAYQGHGKLVLASQPTSTTLTCNTDPAGGTLTGITLYKYETNGY